jgi:hypothetical protein
VLVNSYKRRLYDHDDPRWAAFRDYRESVKFVATRLKPWRVNLYVGIQENEPAYYVIVVHDANLTQRRRAKLTKGFKQSLVAHVKCCSVKVLDVAECFNPGDNEFETGYFYVYEKADTGTESFIFWVLNGLHRWSNFTLLQGKRWKIARNEIPCGESSLECAWHESCDREIYIIAFYRAVRHLEMAAKLDSVFCQYLHEIGIVIDLSALKKIRDMCEHADMYLKGEGGIGTSEDKALAQRWFAQNRPNWITRNLNGTDKVVNLDMEQIYKTIEKFAPKIDLRINELTGQIILQRRTEIP